MFARFENYQSQTFRYRILFGGVVAPCLASTSAKGKRHLPDLYAVHCEPLLGCRRLTPRVNRRKEGRENYERHSASQKAGRGQLISGRNQGNAGHG
jgi:hypothetical protein